MEWFEIVNADSPPPPARYGHAADDPDGVMYVFGGLVETGGGLGNAPLDLTPKNDLWQFQKDMDWEEIIAADPPPARADAGMVKPEDGNVYIFGGVDANGDFLPDVWRFDPSTNTWTQRTNFPCGGAQLYQAVGMSAGGSIGAAGLAGSSGCGGGLALAAADSTLWLYDTASDTWSEDALIGLAPPPRLLPATAQIGNKVFIFGGEDPDVPLNCFDDTWIFDLNTRTWEQGADVPLALCNASAARLGDDQIMLFGGEYGVPPATTKSDRTFLYTPDLSVEEEVDPGSGGTLTYTDPQGNDTTVDVPPDAVGEPTDLVYTPVFSPTHPVASLGMMGPALTAPDLGFAGHAFTLEAYQGGVLQPDFTFAEPVIVTIEYSDADLSTSLKTGVEGLDENTLTLDYWDETAGQWPDAATTCDPASTYDRHPDENWLALPICHLSEFALVGKETPAETPTPTPTATETPTSTPTATPTATPTPTPSPTPMPVGGIVVPVNRLGLLAPWLGLAALVSVAALTVALVRRRRSG